VQVLEQSSDEILGLPDTLASSAPFTLSADHMTVAGKLAPLSSCSSGQALSCAGLSSNV
jgi:hypothetical protein